MILGSILGLITGLLPGLGLFSGLILIYPYLQTLDVSNLLIFYISMAATSQYMGSISAIILQVPGEANSIFALKESQILNRQNKIAEALGSSAVGSVFGGIGAVLITFFFLQFFEPIIPYFFRSDVKAIILLCSTIAFVFFSENKTQINCLFCLVGFLLSMIGISPLGEERTLGIDKFISGIPWFPLSLGIMVIPKIWMSNTSDVRITSKVKFYFDFFVVLRSTLAGYLGGMIPGISYIMGSKLAWIIENKISKDPLKRLLAAETANNASAYSMLIPLLLLGVPIVNSEAIILELASNKGFVFNWNTIVSSGWFFSTIFPIIFLNTTLGIISYFFIDWLVIWKKIPFLNLIITSILLISMIVISYDLIYDFFVLLVSLIIGYIVRKKDTTPLIISFLLGDQLEQNITRLFFIHNLI